MRAYRGSFSDKADNIACVIKNALAEEKAFKEEADRLTAKAKRAKNTAEFYKEYLLNNMQLTGNTKIATTRNTITIKTNPPSVVVDEKVFRMGIEKQRKPC